METAEKTEWKDKRDLLTKKNVRSISAKEVERLTEQEGYTLIDVRPEGEYKEVHPKGAKNAQIYRLIKDWTAWNILRRAGFAFFGIFAGTEENPDFLADVEALGLNKDSKVIVACSFGGTTKPSQNFTEGKESRSLIAAYVLARAGYSNVLHLDGGLQTWFREDFPVEYAE